MLVHCGKSIPGGGRAEPDRSRGWTVILGESRRAQISSAARRISGACRSSCKISVRAFYLRWPGLPFLWNSRLGGCPFLWGPFTGTTDTKTDTNWVGRGYPRIPRDTRIALAIRRFLGRFLTCRYRYQRVDTHRALPLEPSSQVPHFRPENLPPERAPSCPERAPIRDPGRR